MSLKPSINRKTFCLTVCLNLVHFFSKQIRLNSFINKDVASYQGLENGCGGGGDVTISWVPK